jgi:hypothetical protein
MLKGIDCLYKQSSSFSPKNSSGGSQVKVLLINATSWLA